MGGGGGGAGGALAGFFFPLLSRPRAGLATVKHFFLVRSKV